MKKLFILTMMMLTIFLTSCSKNNNNIVIDNNIKQYLKESFLEENKVSAVFYPNSEGNVQEYLEEGATSLTHIFNSQDEFNEILDFSKIINDFNNTIDFENKTVIIHIFGDVSPRDYLYKSDKLKNETLTINLKLEKISPKVADSTMPYQRVILIVLNKIDFNEVIINLK